LTGRVETPRDILGLLGCGLPTTTFGLAFLLVNAVVTAVGATGVLHCAGLGEDLGEEQKEDEDE
jgi:hypothetical protein